VREDWSEAGNGAVTSRERNESRGRKQAGMRVEPNYRLFVTRLKTRKAQMNYRGSFLLVPGTPRHVEIEFAVVKKKIRLLGIVKSGN